MTHVPPINAVPGPADSSGASSRSEWRQLVIGLALATLGGGALVAAFPPVGAWPLIFVSFVPIAIAQHRVLPARWAGLAPTVGVGIYVAGLAWGALSATQRWWLLLLVPLLMATGWLDRRAHRAADFRHLWWSAPVLWTGGLFAVGLTFLASWLDPAYALYRQPWLIQPVSVFAVSGLDLVILVTNFGLATALLTSRRRLRIAVSVAVAAVLVGWTTASALLLAHGRDGRTVRVAVVQPGLRAPLASTPSAAAASNAAMLGVLEAGTRRAAVSGSQLVVWPEKALQYIAPSSPRWRSIERIAMTNHVYLVVGYSPDPHRFNQAAVLGPSGKTLLIYNKQHPDTLAGDHSIGGPIVVAHTPLGAIAAIICYDLDFDDTGRQAARHGAHLLTVPSEDWAGIANLHYTHLVFRAVENRVAAVKADTAWDSAMIDPEGRILAAKVNTTATSAVLVRTIPLGSGTSAYVTTGNWVGWASLAGCAGWAFTASKGTRRAQGERHEA